MILLYANKHEVRHVKFKPKYCVGCQASNLEYLEDHIGQAEAVTLFGCSGWRGKRSVAQFKELYRMQEGGSLVDMETEAVKKVCERLKKPFQSIRYIVDLDRGRVMPKGINHFWRIHQHRRMQKKFNKYMRTFK